jgi:hypothetical protein
LRKESPRLKIEVLSCEHQFTVSAQQEKTINFWAEIQIRNVGDRHTTIYDASVAFEDSGKKYSLKKNWFLGRTGVVESIPVPAHDVVNISPTFFGKYEGNDKEQIKCVFTIYHTHQTEKVEAISQRRKKGVN